MSQDALFQGRLFLYAVLWGCGLLLAYDCLRLWRIFVMHRRWLLVSEEVIFWLLAALVIYSLIYRYNSGALRNYVVCGMGLGMVIYRIGLSSLFIRGMSWILRPVRKMFLIFKTFVKNVGKTLKSEPLRRTIKVRKLRSGRQEDHDGS